MKKIFKVCFTVLAFSICMANITFAGQWEKQQDGKWKYANDDGSYAKECWINDNGKEYYLKSDGTMSVNSFIDAQSYVGKDGAKTDNVEIDEYLSDVHYPNNDFKLSGDWKNEAKIRKVHKKLAEDRGISYFIFSHVTQGELSGGNTYIDVEYNGYYKLWKSEDENGERVYQLDMNTRVKSPLAKFVLKCMCALISEDGDNTLYNVIYDDYEGDETYGLNYDYYVTIGPYEIKPYLDTYMDHKRIMYFIKYDGNH